MARAADSYVTLNVIDDRANKTAYRDTNNDPMDNAPFIVVGNDPSGTIAPFNWAMIFTQAAPASSGTRYAGLVKGALAVDIVNGKLYIKTSAVGATDAWAVVGAQT
jgi:hypothetical protein